MSTVETSKEGSDDTGFFGHPKGLAVLFFAEMWERFSYYGMRALLVFYVTQHFLFDDAFGQGIYGTYASMVYLMPVLGGFLADRYLGQKKAVKYGALLLVVGHFGMAFEGEQATQHLEVDGQTIEIEFDGRADARQTYVTLSNVRRKICGANGGLALVNANTNGGSCPAVADDGSVVFPEDTVYYASESQTDSDKPTYKLVTKRDSFFVGVFYFALSFIIMGVGFLKANISSIVGSLYAAEDSRRDQGFTIFYMGINLGSVMATLACGYLGSTYGWSWGFGLAGIGMLFGYVVFTWGHKYLEGHGDAPNEEELKKPILMGLNQEWLIYIGGVIGVVLIWQLIQYQEAVRYSLYSVTVVAIVGVVLFTFGLGKIERERIFTALALIMFSVIFWMLFEQAGSSLNLFAQRNTDLSVFGLFDMKASQTQFFNPMMIVLAAPIFSLIWAKLAARGIEPSTPVKFALGLIQVGLGFLVLVFGTQFASGDAQVGLVWLVLAYLLHSTGELCLSPVGLSMITKLSVTRVVSLMMGIWFLSSSIAHSLAGLIASSTATETIGGQTLDKQAQLVAYVDVFTSIGILGIVVGIIVLLLSPVFRKGMHGVH